LASPTCVTAASKVPDKKTTATGATATDVEEESSSESDNDSTSSEDDVAIHAFDRQTDRQTEFSLLDRVCIPCSAVIIWDYIIYISL